MNRKHLFILVLISISFVLFAKGDKGMPEPTKGEVIVASKIDTEGSLLGNIIYLVLGYDGFAVVDNISFGPTPLIREAITSGEIDIYPEYTGNGAYFFDKVGDNLWNDSEAGYLEVKKLDNEANNIIWLTPAPANNTWAIAVRQDLADAENLVTLSDLADYINGGGKYKIAGSEEFTTSAVALPAFEEAYGFNLESDQLLILSGGNTTQTELAASRETDGVNSAMAYGTDGQLAALGLVILTDNLGVQPVYEPTAIIRGEVLEMYPEIADLLKPVFEKLDLVTLQTLNSAIAVEGRNAQDVAYEWLIDNGFLN